MHESSPSGLLTILVKSFSLLTFTNSVQSLSRVWLCDPMDFSMLGFPVHYQLLKFTQTHVHWVGDAIQWSHPLSSLSPPAFNLSRHKGLFKWILHIRRPKYWSFKFSSIQDWFPLVLTDWISLLSKGLSRVFSNTTVQKHQFFESQLAL